MDINYYERSGRVIAFNNDESYIHPYILLSDSVMYASKTMHLVFLYMHLDLYKNEHIEKMVPFFFQPKPGNKDILAVFNELQPMIKKIREQCTKRLCMASAAYP